MLKAPPSCRTARPGASGAQTGAMAGLGALPFGIPTWGFGTNYDGSVIVGMSYYGFPSVTDYAYQAAEWSGGAVLGLGGAETAANAVSANGSVVVGWFTSGDRYEAFRGAGGVMTGLGYLPGGYHTIATGTSADGSVVVGYGN
jgi:probable HAF family extracellular repeat protein